MALVMDLGGPGGHDDGRRRCSGVLRGPGSDAQSLRRARTPRRGSPYRRQPDARMAPVRYGLASPSTCAQRAVCMDGLELPDRFFWCRDLGTGTLGRSDGHHAVRPCANRFACRCPVGSRDRPDEPERALSPEHADDRATALRPLASRRRHRGRVGATSLNAPASVGWRHAGGARDDALRGLVHCGRPSQCGSCCAPASVDRRVPSRGLPGSRDWNLSFPQLGRDGCLVRHIGLFRS